MKARLALFPMSSVMILSILKLQPAFVFSVAILLTLLGVCFVYGFTQFFSVTTNIKYEQFAIDILQISC